MLVLLGLAYTISAIRNGERGEPIGMPNICLIKPLKQEPLKTKKVVKNQIDIINSSCVILVLLDNLIF